MARNASSTLGCLWASRPTVRSGRCGARRRAARFGGPLAHPAQAPRPRPAGLASKVLRRSAAGGSSDAWSVAPSLIESLGGRSGGQGNGRRATFVSRPAGRRWPCRGTGTSDPAPAGVPGARSATSGRPSSSDAGRSQVVGQIAPGIGRPGSADGPGRGPRWFGGPFVSPRREEWGQPPRWLRKQSLQ